MPPSMVYKLFFAMEDENVKAGTEIIKAGEECDKCYIIENGTADVLLSTKNNNGQQQHIVRDDTYNTNQNTKDAELLWVGQFYSGETFGENAQKGKVREATVISRTEMDLLSISNQEFLCLQQHIFQPNSIIIQEGDQHDSSMCIVEVGSVKLIKN
ncbi:hypothetical protein CYY_003707, partial [Polysphondylium violaceum]